MKKIMKNIIWFFFIILFAIYKLIADTPPIDGKIQDVDTYIKILTPLGHQPNDVEDDEEHKVVLEEWNDVELETCEQKYLYNGGVFKQNNNGSYTEKNNFLTEHNVNCIFISGSTIYAGTDNGIRVSTDNGDKWLAPSEDGIENLIGETHNIRINALNYHLGKLFACTEIGSSYTGDNGLYISTDNGANWIRHLDNKNVTSVEFVGSSNVYAGTKSGLYLSTDSGDNWPTTRILTIPVNCIMYLALGNVLYVGTLNGLKKSLDGGSSWIDPDPFSGDPVLSISSGNLGIYIGTKESGFWRSTDDGLSFSPNNFDYPEYDNGSAYVYHKIFSILEINNVIYMATEIGLYKNLDLNGINWDPCPIYIISTNTNEKTKMLYYNAGVLWVACYEEELPYGDAEIISNREFIFEPKYFPRYNCHEYAWHLSEGGQRCNKFNTPYVMHYIPLPESSYTTWEKANWDYINCTENDPFMEKVIFGNGFHSCIKSKIGNEGITNVNDMYFESKWNFDGPLVRHKLTKHPFANSTPITFWRSKKEVSGDISSGYLIENQAIGRQIITKGTTIIPACSTVTFYTGPMIDHVIHLKDGFHAESGSTFHAYIKDTYNDQVEKPCKIPWDEVIPSQSPLLSQKKSDTISINKPKEIITYNNNLNVITKGNIFTPCKENDFEFTYSGKGAGTQEDPYQVETILQFQEMREDFFGDHFYILINDIDASETRYWHPRIIDGDTLFYGGFQPLNGDNIRSIDGRGHKISNLYMHNHNFGPLHLFIGTNCFTLKRIGFENLTCEGNGSFGIFQVSLSDSNGFMAEECYFTGTIIIDKEGESGNLFNIGAFYTNATIKNCYSDFTINTDSTISNFGKIVKNDSIAKIANCYALGNNSPSRVLSPFGYNGNVVSCFWDAEKIKVTNDSLGLGLGLTTADMMKRTTFESAGWDFENVWYIEEGMDYPKLKCFRDGVGVEDKVPVKTGIADMLITGNSDKIKIEYTLPTPGQVRIKIFNSLGALEGIIFEGFSQFSDSGSTQFDASALPSGMYFITLESAGIRLCRQYALIK